jgi:hypothetical protein
MNQKPEIAKDTLCMARLQHLLNDYSNNQVRLVTSLLYCLSGCHGIGSGNGVSFGMSSNVSLW